MTSDQPLVLYSSPWRLGLQALTPVLFLALGGVGLVGGGGTVPVVLFTLGVGAAGVVLLDLPVRSEFDEDGVTRVCLLRRTHLSWSEVVAVERPGGLAPGGRTGDGDHGARGGLAARTGRRRLHLLVDRCESQAEYTMLRALLDGHATQLRARRPPVDAAPAGRGPRALHRRQSS